MDPKSELVLFLAMVTNQSFFPTSYTNIFIVTFWDCHFRIWARKKLYKQQKLLFPKIHIVLFQLSCFNCAVSILLFQFCCFNCAVSIVLFQFCCFNCPVSNFQLKVLPVAVCTVCDVVCGDLDTSKEQSCKNAKMQKCRNVKM